jgi:hypothetical protein
MQQLNIHFLANGYTNDQSISLGMTRHDKFWALQFKKKGKFSVRSTYRMLIKTNKEGDAWLKGRASSSGVND